MATTTNTPLHLLSLPNEMLILIMGYLHTLEDLTNLSSTCTRLRACTSHVPPNIILQLAHSQSRIFFRPDPHFLLLATARELGDWARRSAANEATFAEACKHGSEGLLSLSLRHCGLTLARVRTLHAMRYSVINPVVDVIDRSVGTQWYATEDFWDGGVSDAYTVDGQPDVLVFRLATYGELFAPELESFVRGERGAPRMDYRTRLEFVKYCIPDWATATCLSDANYLPDGTVDPRRLAGKTGPYAMTVETRWRREFVTHPGTQNLALIWLLQSSRWRPHWDRARRLAGTWNFKEEFDDSWLTDEEESREYWRQRLWENVMVCQGIDGLAMMRPGLRGAWFPKIREWRDRIEGLRVEDRVVQVGRQSTRDWPYLMGDLRILISGYNAGS